MSGWLDIAKNPKIEFGPKTSFEVGSTGIFFWNPKLYCCSKFWGVDPPYTHLKGRFWENQNHPNRPIFRKSVKIVENGKIDFGPKKVVRGDLDPNFFTESRNYIGIENFGEANFACHTYKGTILDKTYSFCTEFLEIACFPTLGASLRRIAVTGARGKVPGAVARYLGGVNFTPPPCTGLILAQNIDFWAENPLKAVNVVF